MLLSNKLSTTSKHTCIFMKYVYRSEFMFSSTCPSSSTRQSREIFLFNQHFSSAPLSRITQQFPVGFSDHSSCTVLPYHCMPCAADASFNHLCLHRSTWQKERLTVGNHSLCKFAEHYLIWKTDKWVLIELRASFIALTVHFQ